MLSPYNVPELVRQAYLAAVPEEAREELYQLILQKQAQEVKPNHVN